MNDRIAETHTSLAYVRLLFEWDWAGAEESFKRAIEINPYYPTAHHWYSFFLSLENRAEESIREQNLALELDPLSSIINKGLGHRLLCAGRYHDAIEAQLRTLEIDSDFAPSFHDMGYAYLELGEYSAALEALEKARTLTGELSGLPSQILGYAYGISGKIKDAKEVLDQYIQISNERYVSPYLFASLYLGLNDLEECFRWLNIAFQEHDVSLVLLKAHPAWNQVRDDPRFVEICSRIWPENI